MITVGLRGKHFWSSIYFHGQLEQIADQHQDPAGWLAPDLVSSDTPKEEIPLGVCIVKAFDQECKAFIWEVENYFGDETSKKCGLIAALTDVKGLEDAEKKYNEKCRQL